ncbi:Inositol-3-phosphate synthase [Glycine max]|nr:hypothetical protein JHK85_028228 [Glycine max]KAH1228505.1 Inositol-3-phosphate synthase [Glycine max]
MAWQYSPLVDVSGPHILVARVSTKGSCVEATANAITEEPFAVDVTTMGLYIVGEECTQLVALGKLFDSGATIHHVPYTNDVVRVSVVTIYNADVRVPFLTLEIQYVREAVNTFIGWPMHLVKPISDDSHNNVVKAVGCVERCNTSAVKDSLGELMKILYDVYQKLVQLPWDGTNYGLPNVEASFFITHVDLIEIISSDKCLNISILQLWMMFIDDCGTSKGHGSVYGFLEPQSIHNAKDRHQQCQHYIETWVKELQRQLYLGAYLNYTFKGMSDQAAPRWIEAKSHVQTGGYEYGYYVMHWMWCIVTGGLKDEWNMVNPDDIVFGGWDINNMNLADAMARAKVFDINLQKQLRPYMESMLPFPKIYDPNFIATN